MGRHTGRLCSEANRSWPLKQGGLSYDEHLTLFTQIDSEVAVQVANLDATLFRQALVHSDNTPCPDWAMLNSDANITPTLRNAAEEAFQTPGIQRQLRYEGTA